MLLPVLLISFTSKTRNIYLTITITTVPGIEKNGIYGYELLGHVFFKTHVDESNVKLIIWHCIKLYISKLEQPFLGHKRRDIIDDYTPTFCKLHNF